jgi:hypothetical protein
MKKIFMLSTVAVLLLMSYTKIYACPKCNEDFRQQLLNERANTLGAQELLKTIENQSSTNQYVPGPVKYVINDSIENQNNNQQLTDNNDNDNADNFLINELTILGLLSPFGFLTASLIVLIV